jgi:hypothetical protein
MVITEEILVILSRQDRDVARGHTAMSRMTEHKLQRFVTKDGLQAANFLFLVHIATISNNTDGEQVFGSDGCRGRGEQKAPHAWVSLEENMLPDFGAVKMCRW